MAENTVRLTVVLQTSHRAVHTVASTGGIVELLYSQPLIIHSAINPVMDLASAAAAAVT
jgi:hypothetical protein